MIHLRTAYSKIFIFLGFVVFGLVLGFLSIRFDHRYDSIFPFDILGDLVRSYWITNNVLASVLVWAILGAIITIIFKPKIIAWIMGVYVVLFGVLWLVWESLHW